jgi:hypothetical protein
LQAATHPVLAFLRNPEWVDLGKGLKVSTNELRDHYEWWHRSEIGSGGNISPKGFKEAIAEHAGALGIRYRRVNAGSEYAGCCVRPVPRPEKSALIL